jgi:arylsulfatase A-like enzyme
MISQRVSAPTGRDSAVDAALLASSLGFAVYAAIAAADTIYHGAPVVPALEAALLYGIGGLAASLGTLALARLVGLVRRRGPHAVADAVSSVVVAGFALAAGYGVVILNRWVLTGYSWRSTVAIAATAGLVAVVAGIALVAARSLARRLRGRSLGRRMRVALALFTGAMLVGAAFTVLSDRTVVAQPDQSPGEGLPNVVILISDCARRDHVSAYGYPQATTPTFDRIAAEGVVFEDAHATASWTLASVTGILASTRAGIEVRPGVARTELDASTLPEVLSELGYTTIAASNNPHLGGPFGIGGRFHAFDSGTRSWQRALDHTLVGVVRQRFLVSDGAMVDRVLRTLDDVPEPFFLYLHVMGGHAPYEHPGAYEPAFEIPEVDEEVSTPHARMEISEAQRANLVARYDVMLRYADDQLARVVESLDERGALDRTVLVYSADHGEEFGEHGDWTHGRSLHAETVRVPLAVRWPGGVPAGERRTEVVSLLDLSPSLLALVAPGRAPELVPARWQGVDRRFGERAPLPAEPFVLAELGPSFRAVITPRWKYMLDESDGSVALYDRIADPRELDDVAAAHPDVVAELEAALRARLQGSSSGLRVDDRGGASPALIEQLRALGYIED